MDKKGLIIVEAEMTSEMRQELMEIIEEQRQDPDWEDWAEEENG